MVFAKSKKQNKIAAILLLGCFITMNFLSGCTNSNTTYQASGFYLDTSISITLYGCGSQKTADEALKLCGYYEDIFSSKSENSLLYQLNEAGTIEINSEETTHLASLIEYGIEYCEMTAGALDITVEPVSKLWNFGNSDEGIPDSEQLEAALKKVDYTVIEVDDNEIRLNGSRIELGAIAKGYIADRIEDYLIENGVDSAIINLGGNILCLGEKPDGSSFNIGIKRPFGESTDIIETVAIKDLSTVTSGIYERYFYENDKLYHHILNPKTGYPCDNGLASVTIISKSSAQCDCLSTGCFVMGMNAAMELIDSMEGVYAVFIDENNNIYYSQGTEALIK